MKLFYTCAISGLVLLGACKVSGEETEKSPYAHMTQDAFNMDLDTGDLFYKDEPISLEHFEQLLKESYSVYLSGESFSGEQKVVPARHLLAVLDRIDQAGIDSKLVRLNLLFPSKQKQNQFNTVGGTVNGATLFDRGAVSGNPAKKVSSVFRLKFKGMTVDYQELLSELRARSENTMLAELTAVDRESVKVSAQIYEVKPDGSRSGLTRPTLTTRPGRKALLRVVASGPGWETYSPELDEFHQEDLANLGVVLSVKPQIIGDYVRVSGVVVITKLKGDRVGVFVKENIPVSSYSCTKVVVPFSVIFPPGKKSVEFSGAKVGDATTLCRIEVSVVDDRGMTREERER